jgi:hypothetical protein
VHQQALFDNIPSKITNYEPYSSVLWGTDADALPMLLKLHAPDARILVDVTANRGRIWRGTGIDPIRLDVNPGLPIDAAADFRALPLREGSVDVLVSIRPTFRTTAGRPCREVTGKTTASGRVQRPTHRAG